MKFKRGKVTLSMILILVFFILFFVTPVFANESTIQKKNSGFEVITHDQKLINMFNMTPGDIIASKLTIVNNFENEVEIYFRAERLDEEPAEEEPDLYKQIQMIVKLDGVVITDGPMSNIAKGNGVLLGLFQPKESREMEVIATLPNQEAGNEFMGLSHENRFVFTASGQDIVVVENEDAPLVSGIDTEIIEDEEIPVSKVKIPKKGGIPAELFFLAGAAIVVVGIVLKKKIHG